MKLQSGANDARSDDTSRLKAVIAEWLNAHSQHDPPEQTTAAQWLPPKLKKDRGIGNDVTGGLLCPIDYDWDDPEYVICSPFFFTMV